VNSHKNARLTYQGRRILVFRMIHEGLPVREAARAQGVRPRTAYKGLRRYREEGEAGLFDRSSRPHRGPRRTPEGWRQRVIELRNNVGPTMPSPLSWALPEHGRAHPEGPGVEPPIRFGTQAPAPAL